MGGVRVAYTLEQCWHDAPGGTAVAALEVARRLAPCRDVTLVGVAGRHRAAPAPAWRSPIPIAQLALPRPVLEGHGTGAHRLATVPLGVVEPMATTDEIAAVRAAYDLPARFVLFVGTLEPRKNLSRLAAAMRRLDTPTPLVVAGPTGWG